MTCHGRCRGRQSRRHSRCHNSCSCARPMTILLELRPRLTTGPPMPSNTPLSCSGGDGGAAVGACLSLMLLHAFRVAARSPRQLGWRGEGGGGSQEGKVFPACSEAFPTCSRCTDSLVVWVSLFGWVGRAEPRKLGEEWTALSVIISEGCCLRTWEGVSCCGVVGLLLCGCLAFFSEKGFCHV